MRSPLFKKLDILIVKAFVGPFIATFFVTVFVLVLQFFWLYIDDVVGKGVDVFTVLRLVLYLATTLVPLALPLAVLLSSIMTLGNLGETFELIAIKSAGISLLRFMRPLFFVSLLLTIIAFFFNNNVLPVATLKLNNLKSDIILTRPAFDIREGVFYDKLTGFVIKIGKKDKNDSTIHDVVIYEQEGASNQDNIIIADSGKMVVTPDKQHLIFTLKHGTRYQDKPTGGFYNSQLVRMSFDTYKKVMDLSVFNMIKTDENQYKNNYQHQSLPQLTRSIDSIHKIAQGYIDNSARIVNANLKIKTWLDTSGWDRAALDTTHSKYLLSLSYVTDSINRTWSKARHDRDSIDKVEAARTKARPATATATSNAASASTTPSTAAAPSSTKPSTAAAPSSTKPSTAAAPSSTNPSTAPSPVPTISTAASRDSLAKAQAALAARGKAISDSARAVAAKLHPGSSGLGPHDVARNPTHPGGATTAINRRPSPASPTTANHNPAHNPARNPIQPSNVAANSPTRQVTAVPRTTAPPLRNAPPHPNSPIRQFTPSAATSGHPVAIRPVIIPIPGGVAVNRLATLPSPPATTFEDLLPDSVRQNVMDKANIAISNAKSGIDPPVPLYENEVTNLHEHEIAWHEKLTYAAAVLVMFLIGAPLGSIIRKGGIGLPLVFAVIFFVIFFLLNNFGRKFTKEGVMSAVEGMWLATYVLTPIGLFLTYKAMHDSQLFNKEFYFRLTRSLKQFFRRIRGRNA